MTVDEYTPTTHIRSGSTTALRDAAEHGYWLTRRQLDNGEYAWTWLLDGSDTAQPVFITRRQAIDHMSERLRAEL